MQGGKADVDPLRAAALALREKNGLPHGVAKLETAGGDGDRVDYFRGKDLVRYLREHPDKFSNVLKDKTGKHVANGSMLAKACSRTCTACCCISAPCTHGA